MKRFLSFIFGILCFCITTFAVNPTDVSIQPASTTIKVGKSVTLSAVLTPSSATTSYSWGTIAGFGEPYNFTLTPNGGSCTVKADKEGTVYIAVQTSNGLTATCIVSAVSSSATSITLTHTSLTLCEGETYSVLLKATVLPANSGEEVDWQSSNTSVVKAYSGKLIAVNEGSAVVTASTSNGLQAKCNITVIPQALEYEYNSSTSTATVVYCDNDLLTTGAITVPSTVKSGSKTYNVSTIGKYAFSCPDLETLVLSSGLKTIEDYAFEGCSSLENIEIPNTVKTVGEYIFKDCYSLSKPVYNSSLFIYMPSYGTSSQQYDIPDGIQTICYAAFAENRTVKTVTIPASVTDIEDKAFNGSKVNKVICLAQTPPSCNDYSYSTTYKEFLECFDNTQYNGTLVVPDGKRSKYKSADVWENFETIKEQSESTTSLPADGSTLTCSDAVYYASQLEHNTPTSQTYTIKGYVTATDGTISSNQQTFWMADTKNGGKIFEIYWGNVSEKLQVGDYVKCTGHLARFYEISEMINPNVILISRNQSQATQYVPNWVEIRYYPQYNFHSLDMFIEKNNATKELLRFVFDSNDVHKICGKYSTDKGNLHVDIGIEGYYLASNNTWYDIESARVDISFDRNEGSEKVYRIVGGCSLTNGKEMEFYFVGTVYPVTVTIENDEMQYSDFYLTDKIEAVKINNENKAAKLLQNGQILIQRDGKTYNTMGVQVR